MQFYSPPSRNMNWDHASSRVNSFVRKHLKFLAKRLRHHLVDLRDNRGKRRHFMSLLNLTFVAFLAGCRSASDFEFLSSQLDIDDPLRRGGKAGRIPRSTLYDYWKLLDPPQLHAVLVDQVRHMNRRAQLAPRDLPCGVVTIDGKSFGAISHDADGLALDISSDKLHPAFHVRVLRAVLSSSDAKIAIAQQLIHSNEGEISALPRFMTSLCHSYRGAHMFDIFDVDAGLLSKATFGFVDQTLKCGFIAALKGNQLSLYQQARRLLIPKLKDQDPEAISDWEPAHGKEIRRSLFRSSDLDGFQGWSNLRQTWLVRQETREKVAMTYAEFQNEQKKQERRNKRGRKRMTPEKLSLPVLLPGKTPESIPELAALLQPESSDSSAASESTDDKPKKTKPKPKLRASSKARKPKKTTRSQRSANSNSRLKSAQVEMSFDSANKQSPSEPTTIQSGSQDSEASPIPSAKQDSPICSDDLQSSIDAELHKNREDEIEQRYLSADGYLITVIYRFFVTNLTYNRLSPAQILRVVRNHWAVENDCFHSLDVLWREDAPALCSDGNALLGLGILRLLAYNCLQQMRCRYVRVKRQRSNLSDPMPWKELFALIGLALTRLNLPLQAASVPIPSG